MFSFFLWLLGKNCSKPEDKWNSDKTLMHQVFEFSQFSGRTRTKAKFILILVSIELDDFGQIYLAKKEKEKENFSSSRRKKNVEFFCSSRSIKLNNFGRNRSRRSCEMWVEKLFCKRFWIFFIVVIFDNHQLRIWFLF